MTEPVLSGRGLVKSFGENTVLHGVDVDVSAGEIVAVMGPSGSGKSTLLHVVSGILVPDDGEVVFDGRPLSGLTENQRARLRRTAFGFVFQQGHLVAELSGLENVMLPLLLEGVARTEARGRATRWLDRFSVADVAGRRPGSMSGGQMQRVAAARALAGEPRVVFADEPTGALDTLAGERVLTALVEAASENGTAVVLVTHDARIAAYADREIVVRDGTIVSAAVSR